MFSTGKYSFYPKVALLASLLAFIVIGLGAYTRLTDAGLSCPDWPVCYGYITAPHTPLQLAGASQLYPTAPINVTKAWTEMIHRYLAGTLSLLIFFLLFTSPRQQQVSRRTFNGIRIALALLLGSQVILGMLTVTLKLTPAIVLGHLLTGLSLICLLWWLFLVSSPVKLKMVPPTLTGRGDIAHRLPVWIWLGFIILSAQITLGGWVSTHYAGLACIDLPFCNGKWIPDLHLTQLNSDLITIHMLHRFGALITAIYLSLLTLVLLLKTQFRHLGIVLLILLITQVSLGVLNILWLRPVWIALAHNMVATLMLIVLVTLLVRNRQKMQNGGV